MTITRIGVISAETGSANELYLEGVAPTLDSTVPNTGLRCWRFSLSNVNNCAGMAFRTPVDHVRGGFFIKISTGGGDDGSIFRIHSAGNTGLALQMYADPVTISVQNVIVASGLSMASFGVNENEWFHVGFHYVSGEPGSVTIYVNGMEFYTYSGSLWGNIDYITYAGARGILASWGTSWLDDAYTDEITPDEEVGPTPAYRYLPSLISNAFQTEWDVVGAAVNWQALDDSPGIDNDASIVKTQHAGPEDLYGMVNVVLPTDYVIRSVISIAMARKGDAALPATLAGVMFDGLNKWVSEDKPMSLNYRQVFFRNALQPDGTIWDEASYAGMKYGFRATGTF